MSARGGGFERRWTASQTHLHVGQQLRLQRTLQSVRSAFQLCVFCFRSATANRSLTHIHLYVLSTSISVSRPTLQTTLMHCRADGMELVAVRMREIFNPLQQRWPHPATSRTSFSWHTTSVSARQRNPPPPPPSRPTNPTRNLTSHFHSSYPSCVTARESKPKGVDQDSSILWLEITTRNTSILVELRTHKLVKNLSEVYWARRRVTTYTTPATRRHA